MIKFRERLIGVAAPLNLYGRWRKLLSNLVSDTVAAAAGFESLRDSYPGKFDRQIMVLQCFENVIRSGIEGAIAEFGTFRGHTAIQFVSAARRRNDHSPIYLFDSFEGFPPSDDPSDAFWKAGTLASDYDEVRERFRDFPNVTVVKGFFADTLPRFPELRLKFAHVDADMYTSTRDVNQWLLDRIVPRGVIVYDDYGFANCEGTKRAVDEAMSARTDYFGLFFPTGQYAAVKMI
jgi:O-methyltransferase